MSTDRKQLATQVVEDIQELLAKETPPLEMQVHWDDCDCDERRFWFHFRLPGLLEVKDSPRIRRASAFIQNAKRLTQKQLNADTPYSCHWELVQRPQHVTQMYDRRTYFAGYSTDSWVYVLSFYGGL